MKKTYILYCLGFFFALGVFLPLYFNSTYLTEITKGVANKNIVSLIYVVGSLLSAVSLLLFPYILRRWGAYTVAVSTLVLYGLSLLLLGFYPQLTLLSLVVFIGGMVTLRLFLATEDIFLETYSNPNSIGHIRGVFMTSINTALILSPVAAGYILQDTNNFQNLYITSAALLLPALFIVCVYLRNFKDPEYVVHNPLRTLTAIWKEKNIRAIIIAHQILRIFYGCMVVYTPLYLYQVIGFTTTEIGAVTTFVLLPFILFELPLGHLADKRWGEKELLVAGFCIMTISTGILSIISSNSLWVWAAALFMTRTGASFVEIMSETYFFKIVPKENSDILGFFRATGPIGYIAAGALAIIIQQFTSLQWLFFALALFLFIGLVVSTTITDTDPESE